MEILDNIPFLLDAKKLMTQAHVEAGSSDAAEFQELIEIAQDIGKPKAAYEVSFVTGRDGDKVEIDNVVFTSRTLAHNLKSIERVFPQIATCGNELDKGSPAEGDIVKEFWWDLLKGQLLNASREFLSNHLHTKFRLGKTATMRPGSGDASVWPIEQQKNLFALLDGVEEKLGVELTDSFLMVPNKTVSGMLFPTETDFRSCEVCHREDCSSRQAPFNPELWEEIQHD